MKILVVEDDPDVGWEVAKGLRRAGFAADLVTTLGDADVAVTVSSYDCLVLDRMLPDGDGLTFLEGLHARHVLTPVLMLTARDSVADRVTGFDHGADDYLVKPFAAQELIARVRALGRRAPKVSPRVLESGTIRLDIGRHTVTREGVLLSVGGKEFQILELLLQRVGDVVTRTELIEHCWDDTDDPASNVVDVAVGKLRRRLGEPQVIDTIRGVGYRLEG